MNAISHFLTHSLLILLIFGVVGIIIGYFLGLLCKCCYKKKSCSHRDHAAVETEVERKVESKTQLTSPASQTTEAEKELPEESDEERQRIHQARERANKTYAQDLDSGNVKHDENLGFLYTKKPTNADDLTTIYGVGEVINKKLNDFGVYTFKQIALWDRQMISAFAEKLGSFKDRIIWDNWQAQAEKLHYKKYNEKI